MYSKKNSRSRRKLTAAIETTPIKIEGLENRQLMTALSITDFGATSNGDARAAIQAALNAAKPGDSVVVPAGTYNVSNTLNLPTGVTLTGVSNAKSHLNFNLPFQTYGLSVNANASNVTIENLDIVSNSGVLRMDSGTQYTNIHVINNRLQFGGTYANGTYVFGIWGHTLNEGLQINNNYFHDSIKSVRDWEVYYAKDARFDHNTLYNTFDGGHIMEPQDNVSFSYNYGSHISRMGQEIQGDTASHNLKVVGNTFTDWVNPFYDSFGLSVVNHNAINTLVAGNYLNGTIAQGSSWGRADSGGTNRFGYGIEIGAVSATVKNNTLVGNWVAGIVSSRNATVQDNQIWGTYKWGDLTTEGGLDGGGKETLINNTIHASNTGAPATPANPNDFTAVANGSDNTSGTTTTPVTTLPTTTPVTAASGISNLVVTVISDNSVKLTWSNDAGLTGARIGVISTVGRQAFAPVAIADGATSATITGLHAGWHLDLQITGKNTAGAAASSSVATVQMTGDGSAVAGSTPTLLTVPVTPTGPAAPVTAASITGVTAVVLDDNTVKLTWTNSAAISSASVSIVTTVGRQSYTPIALTGNVSTVTLTNLHAGWHYDLAITGTFANGSTVSSDSVTVQMTGNSQAAAPTNAPAAASSSAPTSGTTTQPGSTTPVLSNVTARVLSDTSVKLSWTLANAAQTSVQIGVVTTVGRKAYPGISYATSANSATITGLHAGWQYDFTVVLVTDGGATVAGDPVTVQTTGNSLNATATSMFKLSSKALAA